MCKCLIAQLGYAHENVSFTFNVSSYLHWGCSYLIWKMNPFLFQIVPIHLTQQPLTCKSITFHLCLTTNQVYVRHNISLIFSFLKCSFIKGLITKKNINFEIQNPNHIDVIIICGNIGFPIYRTSILCWRQF